MGIEADLVRGREEQMAELLDAREWDYVVGSVHFLQDQAVDMRESEWDIWESADPEKVWTRYFETLGHAASTGLFDILAHPDLVKVWGRGAPRPDGDLRRFYELAMHGIEAADVAIEVSTAGLRKPVGEIYPDAGFLRMCLEAGQPVALSSDAHVPEDLGHGYDRAVDVPARARRDRAGRVRAAASASGAAGMSARSGIGYDSHRLDAGRPLVLGGVRDPGRRARADRPLRRRRAHPRGDRRAAGRRRPGRHRPALPRHRRALEGRRLARAAGRGLAASCRAHGLDRCHLDATVICEAPKLGPHRDAMRARPWPERLGLAAAAVNVKFTTNEGMGFLGPRRGHGRDGRGHSSGEDDWPT